MSDDVNENETETEEQKTLYEEIVDISGIEYDEDEFDTPDDYKRAVVRWFDKNYPPDDEEAEKKFEQFSQDLQDWVADAATIVKENKTAKRKKKIPAIDDFPGEDEEASKPKKKGRKTKEKAEKESKERGPNRYLRAFRIMLKNPEMGGDELAKEASIAPNAAKYCIEAFKAAETAFKESGKLK